MRLYRLADQIISQAMPIEYTSDESKKEHSKEARYLYARYALLGIIGSLVFLGLSFGGLLFFAPAFLFSAVLAILELRRMEPEESAKGKK